MLTPAQRAAAEEHIHDLANKHGIIVHYCKKWRTSEADYATRQVFIPDRFRHGIDYLTALHEFGHIVDRASRRYEDQCRTYGLSHKQQHRAKVLCEAAAWAWAVTNAKVVITDGCTDTDWAHMGWCWSSHSRP